MGTVRTRPCVQDLSRLTEVFLWISCSIELAWSTQTSTCCLHSLFSPRSSRSSTAVWLQRESLREGDPQSLPGQLQVRLGRTGSRPVVQLAGHHGVSTLRRVESAGKSLKPANKGIGLETALNALSLRPMDRLQHGWDLWKTLQPTTRGPPSL